MKATLAPNRDHMAAATSYRRARNALNHARLSPHTAERELQSAAFWRKSAEHHKGFAAFNAGKVVRTWAPCLPTWEQERELLFGTSAVAITAEVE